MKYDVLKLVIKTRFLILLINFLNCKIGVKCEKIEKIDKFIVIVKRDNFENVISFDFEIISIYVIDFVDVINKNFIFSTICYKY